MKEPRRQASKRLVAGAVALMLVAAPVAAGVSSPPIEPLPSRAFVPVPSYPPKATPVPAIVDTHAERPVGSRPDVVVPTPGLIVIASPRPVSGAHSVSGKASWYCWPAYPSPCAKGYPYGGSYAAAGPALRAAICGVQSCTSWRGRWVSVNGVPVRLIDWCQCHWKTSIEKVIDLYHNVFVQTGGNVKITW